MRLLTTAAAFAFVVGVVVDLTRGVFFASLEEMRGPGFESIPAMAPPSPEPSPGDDPLVARGEAVFAANGCGSCHSIDGSDRIGPGLGGVWGSEQPLADGTSVLFTEEYFYESVLRPEAKVVRGFDSAMPSYDGLVDDADLAALAAYVRSLQ